MSAAAETITVERLPSASRLLADAFFDNPPHVYIWPDPATRREHMEWVLGSNLALQDRERSFCIARGDDLDAMGFWTIHGEPGPSRFAQLRAGAWRIPFRLGLACTRRLGEVVGAIDRSAERVLGDEPAWYLHNMVVDERLRGTGVGTRLLGEQLERIGRLDPGARCILDTQKHENVVFYRRLGFEVVSEETVGSGELAFTNWVMTRPAA